MSTTQITGSMIVTNLAQIDNPATHTKSFSAMMMSNLMELRLLKNGVAELNYFGDSHRTRFTPEVFAETVEAFLKEEGIAELEYKGSFLFVQTFDGKKEPVITKVLVDTDKVTIHEAEFNWVVKENANA